VRINRNLGLCFDMISNLLYRLTREEREEKYNKARERIFGSVEKNESGTPGLSTTQLLHSGGREANHRTENEDSNGVSRASSVSAKDKSALGRKKTSKQRRDDSESFDSRSQYVAYVGPQQPTWGPAPAQYMPVNNQHYPATYQAQQQYPNALQTIYNTNQSYPQQMAPNNAYPQAFQPPNTVRSPATVASQSLALTYVKYSAQPVPQATPPPPRYPQPTQQGVYGSPMSAGPHAGWQQQNMSNHSPYQARATPATGPVHPISGIPYAYGQLPVNVDPNDPKSQHPIPGSYNRNGFNPKTQSFVPGNGMAPMPAPSAPYGGPTPHHGSPQYNSPHMPYASFQQPMLQQPMLQQPMLQQPLPPQPGYPGNGAGYGMARQGSNNSLPPYAHGPAPQVQQQQYAHGLPPGPIHHSLPPNPVSHNIPNKPAMSQGGPGHGYSTLPHYGNPATLPQKPT
jgi:SUZ domain-containing RNA-binding protein